MVLRQIISIDLYIFKTNSRCSVIITEDSSLNEIESAVYSLIERARKYGYTVAVENLENYLAGGGYKKIDSNWLRNFSEVKSAEERIHLYFQRHLMIIGNKLEIGQKIVNTEWFEALVSFGNSGFSFSELFWASGGSTLKGLGKFSIERNPCILSIDGIVEFEWFDYYNFDPGKLILIPGRPWVITDAAMNKLKRIGAKNFKMTSQWKQKYSIKIHYYLKGLIKWIFLDDIKGWSDL